MDKCGKESAVGEERAALNEVDLRTLLRMEAGPGFQMAVAPVATLDKISIAWSGNHR